MAAQLFLTWTPWLDLQILVVGEEFPRDGLGGRVAPLPPVQVNGNQISPPLWKQPVYPSDLS